MSDSRTRDLEQKARAEGTPDSVANFLKARVREDAADLELSRILGTFVPDVRRKALKLIVDLPEDRQVLLEAMAMLEEQIRDALQFAIQPREGDAPLPSREVILQSIHRILSPEQARVILDKKEIHEPILVLVPITSAARYEEELTRASQTMEESREPYLSRLAQDQLNTLATQAEVEGNKIKKWKFAITEGAQTFDIPKWDDVEETIEQRRRNFFDGNREHPGPGSKGMSILDYSTYIALMYRGLHQGKPIDCKYESDSKKRNAKTTAWQYTLLNETNDHHLVGAGFWLNSNRSVRLGENVLGAHDESTRLRLAVMGDIEI